MGTDCDVFSVTSSLSGYRDVTTYVKTFIFSMAIFTTTTLLYNFFYSRDSRLAFYNLVYFLFDIRIKNYNSLLYTMCSVVFYIFLCVIMFFMDSKSTIFWY